jgi:hypothetical protein
MAKENVEWMPKMGIFNMGFSNWKRLLKSSSTSTSTNPKIAYAEVLPAQSPAGPTPWRPKP